MKDQNKKTGTAMSRIINTNNIKSVKCNCRQCYHSKVINTYGIKELYCKYYDTLNPQKKKCKRYYDKNKY